jgi:hypothetical protein
MPEGQPPPVHVIVGVNTCVPPVLSVAEEGLTATVESPGAIATGIGELCNVTPFKVTLTNSATVPTVLPAVKSTVLAVVELRDPRLLVRDHKYVTPERQGPPAQAGVAVKVCVPSV